MSEKFEYCQECNTPLSQCGPEGVDGIPTMDCIACKLRDIIAEKNERIAQARTLIEQIGTTGAERIDIIQAAEKWLEWKPWKQT